MDDTAPASPPPSTVLPRSLSVVIPAFNEEQRIRRTLTEIHAFLAARGYDAEILVVDDGSRDATRERCRALVASIPALRVLGHPDNQGKGFAVRTGVLAATKDAVLLCDADLSTPMEDVERLWRRYDAGGDVVIASRRLAESRILTRQPLVRRIMGKGFHFITSLLCVRGIRDTQCGFKLFRAKVARRLFDGLKTAGFAFDVEVLMRARRQGWRVAEVPVSWRDVSTSRVRAFRDSWSMLLEILRMKGLL